ncbi:MAG: hypothetical protein JRH09_08445 [Deltaproteobacteria bacterium]|nr:hypothetical protein [Deltaproteobacteria bacterium]
MSVRVQVILDEGEMTKFKSQALRESKSLSAWLRDAGKKMLQENRKWQSLTDPVVLKEFFDKCNKKEKGAEPDWEEHKSLILESYQGGNGS